MWRVTTFMSVLVGVVSGWIAFMAFDNTPPYEYDASQSTIIPEVVQGDSPQIAVDWKLRRINRICPGTISRQLFDPKTGVILVTYDAVPAALSSNIKDHRLTRTFALPMAALPSGRIGYRAIMRYQCNFFQQFYPLEIVTPNLYFYVRQRDSRNDSRYQ
jgi:hypothetical protein